MSTKIKGVMASNIELIRFCGEKGKRVQLTIKNNKNYVQLTKLETIQLATLLLTCFDEKLHPSE